MRLVFTRCPIVIATDGTSSSGVLGGCGPPPRQSQCMHMGGSAACRGRASVGSVGAGAIRMADEGAIMRKPLPHVSSTSSPARMGCIELACRGTRVAATGTPGIGKSTTVGYLIRLIFETTAEKKKSRTVVYDFFGLDYYYFFDSKGVAQAVPKTVGKPDKLKVLRDKHNFYVVDPGHQQKYCDPGVQVKAAVIMVPSFNSTYWDGNRFLKHGVFLTNSVWKYSELKAAQNYFSPKRSTMPQGELLKRCNEVGFIPRRVFTDDETFAGYKRAQISVMNKLTKDQVIKIFKGEVADVDTRDSNQPDSNLLVYRVEEKNDGTYDFTNPFLDIVSPKVMDQIAVKYQRHLWAVMLSSSSPPIAGMAFEPIVRDRLRQKATKYQYKLARTKDRQTRRQNVGKCMTKDITLGGPSKIREIRLVEDPIH